jgi:formylglycine-generating enzyme required for sulfatase activity/tRNA A-37 threonylcarbamoyl transferase component Bud32
MKGIPDETPPLGVSRPVLPQGDEASRELQVLASRLQQALGELFVVERVLGTGGFAAVFRVRDTVLKRDLAVKVLNPDLLASSRTRERFQREAETVAKLSHPNVVQVHFIGREGDLLYIGMPCIEGGTLADKLARDGALPLGESLRVLTEVAGALAHAHKKGIVHRDIKTQNILLDDDGDRCLVTDFGIARAEDASALTSTGVVIGTPAYLSPEQISGDKGDHRVDIYALGVLAYEIVTGRLPFEGTSTTAAMMKRFEGPPPPPSTVRPEVPRFLDELIGNCLALEPADRFQSADELLAAVRAGSTGETEVVRTDGGKAVSSPARAPARRALPWIGAAMGVLALLVAFAVRSRWTVRSPAAPAIADSSLALIGAGQYVIGSDNGPVESRPAHRVRLGAFRIAVHEVTNREFVSVASAAGLSVPPHAGAAPAAQPVTGIPWPLAAAYCAKRYPNGRLPTEEEWEAAARGRTGRATPWDNATPGFHANLAEGARHGPMPVGSYATGATPEKVYDLIGNVWEWTSSRYRAYPGGSLPASPTGEYWVIRGGAYDTPQALATPWYRGYAFAIASADALQRTGFRCVVPGAGN